MTRLGLSRLIDVSPEVRGRWGAAYMRLKKKLEIIE